MKKEMCAPGGWKGNFTNHSGKRTCATRCWLSTRTHLNQTHSLISSLFRKQWVHCFDPLTYEYSADADVEFSHGFASNSSFYTPMLQKFIESLYWYFSSMMCPEKFLDFRDRASFLFEFHCNRFYVLSHRRHLENRSVRSLDLIIFFSPIST